MSSIGVKESKHRHRQETTMNIKDTLTETDLRIYFKARSPTMLATGLGLPLFDGGNTEKVLSNTFKVKPVLIHHL